MNTDEDPNAYAPAGEIAGLRILVVDDDDQIVETLSRVLAASGAVAIGAATVDAAMERIRDLSVDVVVTDLVMPGTTGRHFIEWLATTYPDIPVVAISGIPEQNARAADRPNVRATLAKPLSITDLLEAIRLAATADPPA